MSRRLLVSCACFTALTAVVIATETHLSACGDKFLRFGRSARTKTYAAIHPASILLYVPAQTDPTKVKDFEAALKRAGHRPLSVRGMDGLATALAADHYDIVIASEPDARRLTEYFVNAASSPQLLPILVNPAKGALAEIERKYSYVLRAGATKNEMLAEIDRAMKARLRAQP